MVALFLPQLLSANKVPDWYFDHAEDEYVGVSMPGMKEERKVAEQMAVLQALASYLYQSNLMQGGEPQVVTESYTVSDEQKVTSKMESASRFAYSQSVVYEVQEVYTNRAGETFVLIRVDQGEHRAEVSFLYDYYYNFVEIGTDTQLINSEKLMVEVAEGTQVRNLYCEDRYSDGSRPESSFACMMQTSAGDVYQHQSQSIGDQHPPFDLDYRPARTSAAAGEHQQYIPVQSGMFCAWILTLRAAVSEKCLPKPVGIGKQGFLEVAMNPAPTPNGMSESQKEQIIKALEAYD